MHEKVLKQYCLTPHSKKWLTRTSAVYVCVIVIVLQLS